MKITYTTPEVSSRIQSPFARIRVLMVYLDDALLLELTELYNGSMYCRIRPGEYESRRKFLYSFFGASLFWGRVLVQESIWSELHTLLENTFLSTEEKLSSIAALWRKQQREDRFYLVNTGWKLPDEEEFAEQVYAAYFKSKEELLKVVEANLFPPESYIACASYFKYGEHTTQPYDVRLIPEDEEEQVIQEYLTDGGIVRYLW